MSSKDEHDEFGASQEQLDALEVETLSVKVALG